MSQRGFHQLASDLRQKVKIPAAYQSPAEPLRKSRFQLKADLASANDWLAPDNITVACADGGRFLREVYICINKEGRQPSPVPTRCKSASCAPAVSRTSCCAAYVDRLSSSGPSRA